METTVRRRASERQSVGTLVWRTDAPTRWRAGFTLVELAVAAAIAAIVLVGVAVTMGGGILAWRRAEETAQMAREGTAILRELEGQLHRSLASEMLPFEGGAASLHFTMSDGMGPVDVRWANDRPGATVTFAFPMADDQRGYVWADRWADANTHHVPQAVRVALQVQGPRGTVWAVERTITLPHGMLGTIEQGVS